MEHLNDQKGALDLPPYSEIESSNQKPPLADGPTNPPMLAQNQPYYPAVPGQGPIVQPPMHTTVVVTAVQPTNEPDHLAYSIFTMLFCCLPLGIAALVYSLQTREANLVGNLAAAQQNSKMARILAHSALGVGIVLIIVCIIVIAV